MRNAHIVMATFGSLGDLFPFLALGQVLRERGHRVTVATHAMHRTYVEQAGLQFALGSAMVEPDDQAAFVAKAFNHRHGPRFVVHELAAKDAVQSYALLRPLCEQADVLLTSTLAFAAQILGEQLRAQGRLRWLSVVLAPAGFISAYDPPDSGMPWVQRFLGHSAARARLLRGVLQMGTWPWTAPVRTLRRELGLLPTNANGDPFHRGQHAPDGVLALFSPLLGQPQADWPARVALCGTPRYRAGGASLPADLQAFLREGPAPVVFSLGSAAVHIGAAFLRASIDAVTALRQRAVLFTGSAAVRAQLPDTLARTLHVVDYAPHAPVFAQAAAIVHHGGIGTSSEALLAGKPMLVVPHGFDQYDNAARLRRLGVATVVRARDYTATRARLALADLLQNPDFLTQALRCASQIAHEDGAKHAADAIEAAFRENTERAVTYGKHRALQS